MRERSPRQDQRKHDLADEADSLTPATKVFLRVTADLGILSLCNRVSGEGSDLIDLFVRVAIRRSQRKWL